MTHRTTADNNFQTIPPISMKITARGAQHPPSSYGTIVGTSAARIGKHLNSTWVQLSDKFTEINVN